MSGTRQDGSRPALPLEERESHEDENKAFVERVCLPFLLSSQNTDGGWGFRSDTRSRVEASAWALLALRECAIPRTLAEPTARGFRFLEATQLPDGAWPASPESREGCWVTALACWALLGVEEFSGSVRRGLSWLCADQPGEARLLWRLLRRLHPMRRVSSQKDSYYGWSWTSGNRQLGGTDIFCHDRPGQCAREFVTRRQRQDEDWRKPCYTIACVRAADGTAATRWSMACRASPKSAPQRGRFSHCGNTPTGTRIN